jgi:hypothetical protein
MDDYETQAKYNIAETCCASISLDDLKLLSEDQNATIIPCTTKMTYGEIPGLKELRINVANLYSNNFGRSTGVYKATLYAEWIQTRSFQKTMF